MDTINTDRDKVDETDLQQKMDELVPYSDEVEEETEEEEAAVQLELDTTEAEEIDLPPSNDPDLATVVARMQAEINALRSDQTRVRTTETNADEVAAGFSGYPWQIYRRPSRGVMADWIVIAPGGAAASGRRDTGSYGNYIAKGMQPITRYGPVQVPMGQGRPGADFIPMLDQGGAREFPASQVLAYKWHIDPPLAGVTFPAYERIKGTELHFACDDCDVEFFFLPDDTETPRAAFQHLRSQHQYPRNEAALALESMGITKFGGRYALASTPRTGDIPAPQPSLAGFENTRLQSTVD